jgi:hypothetical protein
VSTPRFLLLGPLVLLAATTAGCSLASGSSPTALPSATAPSSGADSPAPSSPESAAPSGPPATALPFEASVCGDSIADSVGRTLTAQFDAFNAGDFDAAYALSSRGFQASADLSTFVRLLVSGYPEVVQSRSHRIDDCRQPGPGVVLAVVEVTGQNERTVRILYRLVLQDEGWRVDGAGGSEPVAAGTA